MINTALINERLRLLFHDNGLTSSQVATLLGIHRSTWARWRKNYELMPVKKFGELCEVLNLGIADALCLRNKGVSEGVLSLRELDMIKRDNQSSGASICEYFGITTEYLKAIRSRGDVYVVRYCCVPPYRI